jgi:3',5'-cyclic-AMP phosphodiesterase
VSRAHEGPLAFAHIGDLHLTRAAEPNFVDLLSIVAQLEVEFGAALDFAVLPGDNADNGLPSQYRLAATALKMLSVPVHAIAGDHDMEQGGLDAFHEGLAADPLPRAICVRGHRCLFLDVNGPGSGGPDFRLGETQLGWVERELQASRQSGETTLVFMHAYPADLADAGECERLTALIDHYGVALVDMGHTHYNELGNDGRTIFAATRSTGQIDEGPVGFSLATIDRGIVSWRFKPLDDPFPFVMITAPVDRRLIRDPRQAIGDEPCLIRAMTFGLDEIASVGCQIGDGDWTPMRPDPGGRTWSVRAPIAGGPLPTLTVRALTSDGRPGQHTIAPATRPFEPPSRERGGSDAASIGAWPENGILGTQLGPNRHGRKW